MTDERRVEVAAEAIEARAQPYALHRSEVEALARAVVAALDALPALCDAADEVERLRKAVWASEEIDRRAGMLAGVEAERDASRTAHAALRDWLAANAPTVLADFDRTANQEDQ